MKENEYENDDDDDYSQDADEYEDDKKQTIVSARPDLDQPINETIIPISEPK